MEEFSICITDQELELYVKEILSSWDRGSVVDYAFSCLLEEYKNHDRKAVIQEMNDFYGSHWMRIKKLETFK